jgi:hypothetical protein
MTPTQSLRALTFLAYGPKPLLSCVSIEPIGTTGATISATDGLIFSRITVDWPHAPTCIVSGKALLDAVKGLDFFPIHTELTIGDCPLLKINGASLRVIVGETFPSMPIITGGETLKVHADDLAKVLYATDKERASVVLMGVGLFGDSVRSLSCVATDGMVLIHAGHEAGASMAQVAILPYGPAALIAKHGGTWDISMSGRMCRMQCDDVIYCFRAIEGTFPNFQWAFVPNMPTMPLSILPAIVAAGQGLAKTSLGVYFNSTGAGPLNKSGGGREIRHKTDIVGNYAVKFRHIEAILALSPIEMTAGRCFQFVGKGWKAVVMPIIMTDHKTRDFSNGAPVGRIKEPRTVETLATLRSRIKHLEATIVAMGGAIC